MFDTDTTDDGSADPAGPLLELRDVYSGYDGSEILHGIDMTVEPDEIVAVVGPNGAGKSTAFKTIFGLLTPTSGEVRFDGEIINGLEPQALLRRGLCYVPQGRSTFPELTVEKNLRMSAYLKDDIDDDLDRVYDRFPVLREKRGDKAKTLSGGQQQMLEMAGGLMMEPDLLLLDEPSLGLAPQITEGVFERIHALNDEGMAFLIIEQNARRALKAAGRGYVIDQGEIALEGDAGRLLADGEVQRLYLGGAPATDD
jgi:branched-chain amino acid transport system ATP-binding protein